MNVQFLKGTGTPKTVVDGGIYFRTDAKIISLGVAETEGGTAKLVDFGGNVTDVSYDSNKKELTVTKNDGNGFTVSFAGYATASAMATELAKRLGTITGKAAIKVTDTTATGGTSKSAQVELQIANKGNVTLSQDDDGLSALLPIPVGDIAGTDDISVTKAGNKFTLGTALGEDITVMGVTVGNLTDKSVIAAGTSLGDILKQILVKEIDVHTQSPATAMKITGATNGSTYEIGTSLSITPSHTYTDGKFIGDTGYSYSVNAGCAETGTTYFVDGTQQTESPFTVAVTKNGSYTLNCKTTYSASTVTPKKNNGNNSTKTIAAGTATSANLSFNGRYYAYMGYSTATTGAAFDSAAIKALNAGKVFLNTTGNTTLVSAAESTGTSIVIACPESYRLTAISNSLGVSIMDNFIGIVKENGTYKDASDIIKVNYTNGGTTTKYKVYVYPITSGAKVAYKGVTITKA